ncbi:MAG TPA: LPS assembly lipoprotein LptE [Anaeromyxobacter sp.]
MSVPLHLRSPAVMGIAVLLLAGAGCGYGFSQRYVAAGGVDRIHVRPFENRSTEPDLGAVVATALREELARRGAAAEAGAGALLDGEVRATEPVLTSAAGATWRIGVELRARLSSGPGRPVERTVRRETDFLAGADPLETEGRRALALRRAAGEAARELLRSLER